MVIHISIQLVLASPLVMLMFSLCYSFFQFYFCKSLVFSFASPVLFSPVSSSYVPWCLLSLRLPCVCFYSLCIPSFFLPSCLLQLVFPCVSLFWFLDFTAYWIFACGNKGLFGLYKFCVWVLSYLYRKICKLLNRSNNEITLRQHIQKSTIYCVVKQNKIK